MTTTQLAEQMEVEYYWHLRDHYCFLPLKLKDMLAVDDVDAVGMLAGADTVAGMGMGMGSVDFLDIVDMDT